jgi:hypothetical protein
MRRRFERIPFSFVHAIRSKNFFTAFSEPPSDSTWLENAQYN